MNASKDTQTVTVFSLKPGFLSRLSQTTWSSSSDLQSSVSTVFNPSPFLYEIDEFPQTTRGKRICVFYIQDACRFGGKCRSAHPMELKAIEKTCMLCQAEIRRSGQFFGLLVNCVHPFCATCIKTWNKSNGHTKTSKCPICRLNSPPVISSVLWLEERLVKQEASEDIARQKLSKSDSKPSL